MFPDIQSVFSFGANNRACLGRQEMRLTFVEDNKIKSCFTGHTHLRAHKREVGKNTKRGYTKVREEAKLD